MILNIFMERSILLICLLFISFPTISSTLFCNGKQIVGNAEKVKIDNLEMDAKMDTGAAMASLSATNIKIINNEGKKWVQFDVFYHHKKIEMLKPLVKMTKILKRKDESLKINYSSRPVIELPICIGNHKEIILVNLIDRSHFQYPLLIGNQVLKKFNLMVDVNQFFVTTPKCGKQARIGL